jgi:hypothetical protein
MTETDEMKMCFDEMEKLNAKMEALREKRKVEEEKRLLRELTMEPNLKVLKTWLDDYREAKRVDIENINKTVCEDKKKRVINQIKNISSDMIRSHKAYEELSQHEKDRMMSRANSGADYHPSKYRNVDFDELEKMLVSVEYDHYNVLTEKLLIINQIYNLRPKPKPTNDEVVKSHIQATYNMFNIINKRLDDIETKLSSNTTITKRDFQPSGW